jgi:hypothetical protein
VKTPRSLVANLCILLMLVGVSPVVAKPKSTKKPKTSTSQPTKPAATQPATAPVAPTAPEPVPTFPSVPQEPQGDFFGYNGARLYDNCRIGLRTFWQQKNPGKPQAEYPYSETLCLDSSAGQASEKIEATKTCRALQSFGRQPNDPHECLHLTRLDTAGGPAWPTPDDATGKCASDAWSCTFQKNAASNWPNEGRSWTFSSTTTSTTVVSDDTSSAPWALVEYKLHRANPGSIGETLLMEIWITGNDGDVPVDSIMTSVVMASDRKTAIARSTHPNPPFTFLVLRDMSTGDHLSTADAPHANEPFYEGKFAPARGDETRVMAKKGVPRKFAVYALQKTGYTEGFPAYTLALLPNALGGAVPVTIVEKK